MRLKWYCMVFWDFITNPPYVVVREWLTKFSTTIDSKNNSKYALDWTHKFPFISFLGKARILVSFHVWPDTEDAQLRINIVWSTFGSTFVLLQVCEILFISKASCINFWWKYLRSFVWEVQSAFNESQRWLSSLDISSCDCHHYQSTLIPLKCSS